MDVEQLKEKIVRAKEAKSTSEQARLQLELGRLLEENQLFNEAIESYLNGLTFLKAKKKSTSLYYELNQAVGAALLEAEKFEMALPYLRTVESYSRENQRYDQLATVLSLEGIIQEKLGAYEKAIALQVESLGLFEKEDDFAKVALVQEHLGSIYEDLELYEKADSLFRESYAYWQGSGTGTEINILNNLGDVLRKKGQEEKSLVFTQTALEMADSLGLDDERQSAYKDLSKCYALLGHYQKAHHYLKKAEQLSEQLQSRHNSDQLNALQALYETQLKQGEIDLLTQQNAAQRSRLYLLLLIVVGLVLFSLLWSRLFAKQKRSERKQQVYKEQLLEAKLLNKQQNEEALKREVEHKTSALSQYSLHLAGKNKLLGDLALQLKHMSTRQHFNTNQILKELAAELDLHLSKENEWDEFKTLFSDIHPHFIHAIQKLAKDDLSSAELRLGMLLRLNLSSKEIASILHITPDSVRVARHRFRKKLGLPKEQDLIQFLLSV